MKREYVICILAFLCGVIIVNFSENVTWINNSALNRYSLALLSFEEIRYEEYFLQILFLRFRTVGSIWIVSRLIPKNIVAIGVSVIIGIILGGVAAMAILANGVWGLLFYCCAIMPHILCYGSAWSLWSKEKKEHFISGKRVEQYLFTVLILVLMGMGCVLEAYVSPVLVKSIIKY